MNEGLQTPVCDQSNTTRRNFLQVLIGVLTFLMGLILGIPLIGSLVGSRFKTAKEVWHKVADLGPLTEGQPVRLNFSATTEDAYHRSTVTYSVWVIKHSLSDVTVFSPICPHLGCYYNWDQQGRRFECPCHISVFSVDGKVLSGPSPRALDILPARIEGGTLFVAWERFKVGIPEKVRV